MTSAGSRAYAHSRVRAWKSRLLRREDVLPLFTASDPASMRRALSALEFDADKLTRAYEMTIRGYRHDAPLLLAMLRLHEIENVKLLWRAVARHRDLPTIRRLWVSLGPLASIRPEVQEATTPRQLAEQLRRTPYEQIARDVVRAHGDDVGAAELAFDRWASQRLLDEARKLPREERLARQLVEMLVRERDSEIFRRGQRWYGLSEAAVNVERASAPNVGRASARRQVNAPLDGLKPVPHGLKPVPQDPALLRRERLRLCRRAFIGNPFRLAPAVAFLLLAEEEVRGVRALVERQGDSSLDAAVTRALAGTQFGA